MPPIDTRATIDLKKFWDEIERMRNELLETSSEIASWEAHFDLLLTKKHLPSKMPVVWIQTAKILIDEYVTSAISQEEILLLGFALEQPRNFEQISNLTAATLQSSLSIDECPPWYFIAKNLKPLLGEDTVLNPIVIEGFSSDTLKRVDCFFYKFISHYPESSHDCEISQLLVTVTAGTRRGVARHE